jgi:hypothetical protein
MAPKPEYLVRKLPYELVAVDDEIAKRDSKAKLVDVLGQNVTLFFSRTKGRRIMAAL